MAKPGYRRSALGKSLALVALLGGVAGGMTACDDSGLKATSLGVVDVTPPKFVFPKVEVNAEPAALTVRVSNRGTGNLKLADISARISADFHLEWAQSTSSGTSSFSPTFPSVIELGPDEVMLLNLTYAPSDALGARGSISFRTNDPTNANVTIPIESAAGGPEINISPSTVTMGRVPAGGMACETLTITNIGSDVLVFESLLIGGSPDFHVSIDEIDVNTDEGRQRLLDPDQDGNAGLSPDQSFTAEVCYLPPTEGPDSGELVVTTNAANRPSLTVPLQANGAAPCITVNPDRLDFGPALVGASTPRPVTITSCGAEELLVTNVYLTDETSPAYSLGEQYEFPIRLPGATPENQPSDNVVVNFNPDSEAAYGGQLVIESNDAATPAITVPILGRGTINACPVPAVAQAEYTVLPLDVVTLDATPSNDPDGSLVRYEWVLVESPEGTGQPHPFERFTNPNRPQDGGRADDPSTPTAQYFVDLAGVYVFELRVTDNLGMVAPSETCPDPVARITIASEPDQDIHIQLTWNTPGDANQTDGDGTDVDMHLLHPRGMNWDQAPLDCYYANKTPDWGPAGPPGNPTLDIDDTSGAGPENINVEEPEDTSVLGNPYRLGIHYYRAESFISGTYGPSTATVRVYLGGDLDYEGEQELRATDNFWDVVGIEWGPNGRRTVEIDRLYERMP